eukprot:jgi/Psemu1/16020/gm1.16020_g
MVLLQLMGLVVGHKYATDQVFTHNELSVARPDVIYLGMSKKVCGTEDLGQEDNSTLGRSSTIIYWNRAILEPMKSCEINNLVKAVKKKETREL